MVVLLCAFAQGRGQGDRSLVSWLAFPSSLPSCAHLGPWVSPLWLSPPPGLTPLRPLTASFLTLGFPRPFSLFANNPPSPPMESFLGAAEAKTGVIITHTRNNPESCWPILGHESRRKAE